MELTRPDAPTCLMTLEAAAARASLQGHKTRGANGERFHLKLQRPVQGRMPQNTLVREPCRCPIKNGGVAQGLHRSTSPRFHRKQRAGNADERLWSAESTLSPDRRRVSSRVVQRRGAVQPTMNQLSDWIPQVGPLSRSIGLSHRASTKVAQPMFTVAGNAMREMLLNHPALRRQTTWQTSSPPLIRCLLYLLSKGRRTE